MYAIIDVSKWSAISYNIYYFISLNKFKKVKLIENMNKIIVTIARDDIGQYSFYIRMDAQNTVG